MSLAWLLPIGAAALAAWLLPLLIHLARRSEHRITDFAALRWLSAKPQPRRRVRFDEWPLLLLRLLLIAAIAALLARPALIGAPDQRAWIVAATSLTPAQLRDAARADANASLQSHWLLPGFPALQASDTTAPDPPQSATASPDDASVDSLLRELDATLPRGAPLTVLVPATLDGADAQRVRLTRAVEWRVLPDASADTTAVATAASTSRSLPSPIMVRHDPAQASALRYLRAAERAWRVEADAASNAPTAASIPTVAAQASPTARASDVDAARSRDVLRIATADAPLDPAIRQLIWLASGPLPDAVREWIAAGGHALIGVDATLPSTPLLSFTDDDWRDDSGAPLLRSATLGRGRVSQWTRPLTPDAMPQLLDASFPARLRTLLSDAPPAPMRVDARVHAPTVGAAPFPDAPRPLDGWLIAAIALLFAIERWMASGARRETVAA